MPFGGFCPLPLRLGGAADEGWSAEQHARVAADLCAAKRVAPVAVLRFAPDVGNGQCPFDLALTRHAVGPAEEPTFLLNGTGDTTITLPAAWVDEFGAPSPVVIRGARAARETNAGGRVTVELVAANAVRVYTEDAAGTPDEVPVTLVLKGGAPDHTAYGVDAEIGEYGGSDDKHDCRTEVIPHAWSWYRFYQDARGSAYSRNRGTLVHAETVALARHEASLTRASERRRCNALALTADERLEWHAEVLAVKRADEPRWKLRKTCAARDRAALGSATLTVDNALAMLLGAAYVRSWRQTGVDLDTPPTQTYWPTANPGTVNYDMGNGAWFSERQHLVVEVQRPAGMTQRDFLYLMNVQLYDMLDRMLPAWATFNWAMNVVAGFALDTSFMDFDGFNP